MPAGAQTWTIIPPNDLAPGESHYYDLESAKPTTPSGEVPVPKSGYLAKVGPFKGVVFDSFHPERLRGRADGMSVPIPSDTARTVDANPVSGFVEVTNPSSNTQTLTKEDAEIILFGKASEPKPEGARFSFADALNSIPGVTMNGNNR